MTMNATTIVNMALEIADRDSLTIDDVLTNRPPTDVLPLYVLVDGQRINIDARWLTAQVWRVFKQSPSQAAVKQAYATLRALARFESKS